MLAQLWRKIRLLVLRDRALNELEAEMRLHRTMRAELLNEGGVSPVDARYVASRTFGNATAHSETSRDAWGFAALDNLRLDVRYGARALRKTPAFTLAAIATLALGIGATTSIYTVAYSLWLKPLPYRAPEQLVSLRDTYQQSGSGISYAELPDLRTLKSFDGVAAYNYGAAIIKVGEEPVRILAYRATDNLFSVLGTPPALGRTFVTDDAQQNNGRVVVVSDRFWRKRLYADPNIIGKPMSMYDQSYTVIGVMPRDFQFPQELPSDVWTVVGADNDIGTRAQRYVQAIARLNSSSSIDRAQAEAQHLARNLEVAYPATNRGWSITAASTIEETIGGVRRAFALLLGTVVLLLLIACANIAGLFLARGTSRRSELALRAALGASRARLTSLVIVESLLVSLGGGAAGVALAYGGAQILASLLPSTTPRIGLIDVDANVIAFAAMISILTGLVCAIAPSSRLSVSSPGDALRSASRAVVRGGQRLQSSLIITEVALSVVLLIGSGLMLRSFFALVARDRGFSPESVLTLHLTAPFERFSDQSLRAELFRTTLEKLGKMPKVKFAAAVTGYPSSSLGYLGGGNITDRTRTDARKPVSFALHAASANYFRAMSTPLRSGRFFADVDRIGAPHVAVVNEAFAKALWPNEIAIGKVLSLPPETSYAFGDSLPVTVVGVVADMHVGRIASPELFIPTMQAAAQWTDIVVSTTNDPGANATAVRNTLRSIEPDFLIEEVVPMSAIISNTLALQRTQSFMVAMFALLAAILSAVGLYGLLSHFVGQRVREIGLRMALGADRNDIFQSIVARGVALAAVGLLLGMIVAYAAIRLLQTRVFGLANASPVVFVTASMVLLVAAFVACYVPARRATLVDPVSALR